MSPCKKNAAHFIPARFDPTRTGNTRLHFQKGSHCSNHFPGDERAQRSAGKEEHGTFSSPGHAEVTHCPYGCHDPGNLSLLIPPNVSNFCSKTHYIDIVKNCLT